MCRRIPLRPGGRVTVCLAPLEALRGQLVGREAAGPRSEAARDDDRLLPVPCLVVGHNSDKQTITTAVEKKGGEMAMTKLEAGRVCSLCVCMCVCSAFRLEHLRHGKQPTVAGQRLDSV